MREHVLFALKICSLVATGFFVLATSAVSLCHRASSALTFRFQLQSDDFPDGPLAVSTSAGSCGLRADGAAALDLPSSGETARAPRDAGAEVDLVHEGFTLYGDVTLPTAFSPDGGVP